MREMDFGVQDWMVSNCGKSAGFSSTWNRSPAKRVRVSASPAADPARHRPESECVRFVGTIVCPQFAMLSYMRANLTGSPTSTATGASPSNHHSCAVFGDTVTRRLDVELASLTHTSPKASLRSTKNFVRFRPRRRSVLVSPTTESRSNLLKWASTSFVPAMHNRRISAPNATTPAPADGHGNETSANRRRCVDCRCHRKPSWSSDSTQLGIALHGSSASANCIGPLFVFLCRQYSDRGGESLWQSVDGEPHLR